MEASKTLRRPANWEDFETLCKKLWGEIWSCPEITKNGRRGQSQNGVDISGIPLGEDKYYGIQSKGKDEYTNKQFTEDEIMKEIEKAKLFQPPLKKLYFATTAVKDAGIEEIVRKINIKNREEGLFEVHIFSWEDIVDLIDENKQTHDWYLKNQNYKTTKSVLVTFQDSLTELIINPKFRRTVTLYRLRIEIESRQKNGKPDLYDKQLRSILFLDNQNLKLALPNFMQTKVNLSYCSFYFQIHNTGLDPIEEYKLLFEFEGEVQDLKDPNDRVTSLTTLSTTRYFSDVELCTDPMSGKVIPHNALLVGEDIYNSDEIIIKPMPKEYEITINWKLISKDYRDGGKLKLIVKPDIERKYKTVLVEDITEVRVEAEAEFEEFIIEKQN